MVIRDFRKRAVNHAAAQEIKDYWKDRGFVVKTDVVEYSETVHGITTDMINALPADLYYERMIAIRRRGG